MDDKEEEERSIYSGEEDRMAGEENGNPEERRKRPFQGGEVFGCSTPRDRPNKRSKSDGGESEDGAATDDLPNLKVSPKTTPRPRTSSPTSTTASPKTTLEIVHRSNVVPGLENTECRPGYRGKGQYRQFAPAWTTDKDGLYSIVAR